ncbi:MAG: hypothetical protein ACKOFN_01085, partial [Vulcanococcus sp.]
MGQKIADHNHRRGDAHGGEQQPPGPLAELAWLIPVLPLAGACLVGLGLISFNRTINRLRKPVA